MKNNKRANKQATVSRGGGMMCWLKLSMSVVLLAGIYFGVRHSLDYISALFPVKEVVFSGNKHLTESELKAMMGIEENKSLLRLSNRELSARLLKSPWVKAVSFRKDFPHRFLARIDEAMPFALLEMNNHMFVVDDKGNLLEEIKGDSMPFLPIITGGDPFKNRESYAEILNLVRAIKEKGVVTLKDRIEIIMPRGAGAEEISMQIDGILVKVGHGEYEEKLERLLELEDEIVRKGIPVDYIDLRFSNRVVVKAVNGFVR